MNPTTKKKKNAKTTTNDFCQRPNPTWNWGGVVTAIAFSRCRRDSRQKCCNRRRRHQVASWRLLPLPPGPRLRRTKSHKWGRSGRRSQVPYMRARELLEPKSPGCEEGNFSPANKMSSHDLMRYASLLALSVSCPFQ